MKILVIFTGGTIGSKLNNDCISVSNSNNFLLIELYQKYAAENGLPTTEFECINPYTILSENLSGEYLSTLAKTVAENITSNYDGIIITHGSDTLQYSASMLDLYFPCPPFPIMLVASNYVLSDERANGLTNFIQAVNHIINKQDAGVFVPYKNSDTLHTFYGSHLLAHHAYSDELYSVDNISYANWKKENSIIPSKALSLPSDNSERVLRVCQYPGMMYPEIKKDSLSAILFDSYHSGTICSVQPSLINLLNQAKEMNIPSFLTGATKGPFYESTLAFKELGLTVLPKASPVAMYMKLWMLTSHKPSYSTSELIELMLTPLSHEFI